MTTKPSEGQAQAALVQRLREAVSSLEDACKQSPFDAFEADGEVADYIIGLLRGSADAIAAVAPQPCVEPVYGDRLLSLLRVERELRAGEPDPDLVALLDSSIARIEQAEQQCAEKDHEIAAMSVLLSPIDEANRERRYQQAEQQCAALREALTKLANEASGFVSLADPAAHGHTNIAVLRGRIAEARAALQSQPDDKP